MAGFRCLCGGALSLWWADSVLVVLALQQAVDARTGSSEIMLRKTTVTGFTAPFRLDSSILGSTSRAQTIDAQALQQASSFGRTMPRRAARSISKVVAHSKRRGIWTRGMQHSQRHFVRARIRSRPDHSTLAAAATTIESSSSDAIVGPAALQRVCDELVAGGSLRDVEDMVANVEASTFSQAEAWKKSWAPMRSMIAEVPDSWAISVLAIPREYVQ